MSNKKEVVVHDIREEQYFDIRIDHLLTQLYEHTKQLTEQRDALLSQIEGGINTVEEAVIFMAVLWDPEASPTADACVVKGLLDEVIKLNKKVADLSTTGDRFSAMKALQPLTLIRLTLDQAREYGF